MKSPTTSLEEAPRRTEERGGQAQSSAAGGMIVAPFSCRFDERFLVVPSKRASVFE